MGTSPYEDSRLYLRGASGAAKDVPTPSGKGLYLRRRRNRRWFQFYRFKTNLWSEKMGAVDQLGSCNGGVELEVALFERELYTCSWRYQWLRFLIRVLKPLFGEFPFAPGDLFALLLIWYVVYWVIFDSQGWWATVMFPVTSIFYRQQ